MSTIIDTDILIDSSRGVEKATALLEELEAQSTLTISVITQLELIVGCRNKRELFGLNRFLKRFEILRLNEAISELGVSLLQQYRLSHGLLIADGLIAATAIHWGYPLISKNQRDYRFITALELLPYQAS